MANTFKLLMSISATLKNVTYQSFQGIDGASIDTAIDILTNGTQPLQYSVDVAAGGTITLWDDADSHGIAKLGLAFILPTVDGVLEWSNGGQALPAEVNNITLRAFVPFIMVGDLTTKEISAYEDHTDQDALGSTTLLAIEQIRFKNLDASNAGQVNILASE